MAASPTPAPRPAAQPGQAPSGGTGVTQILAGITRLATMLSQVMPDAADESKAIVEAVTSVQQKAMQQAGASQTSAPAAY